MLANVLLRQGKTLKYSKILSLPRSVRLKCLGRRLVQATDHHCQMNSTVNPAKVSASKRNARISFEREAWAATLVSK